MMFPAVVLAVIVGWTAGGSLKNLVDMPLKRFEFILAGFTLQALLFVTPGWNLGWVAEHGFTILLLSYAILLFVLWENRTLQGLWVVTIGIALNLIVIAANGGMPVCPDALAATGQAHLIPALESGAYIIHILMTDNTIFSFLADHIATPGWLPRQLLVSPGDLIMVGGIMWMVPWAMQKHFYRIPEELNDVSGQETEQQKEPKAV